MCWLWFSILKRFPGPANLQVGAQCSHARRLGSNRTENRFFVRTCSSVLRIYTRKSVSRKIPTAPYYIFTVRPYIMRGYPRNRFETVGGKKLEKKKKKSKPCTVQKSRFVFRHVRFRPRRRFAFFVYYACTELFFCLSGRSDGCQRSFRGFVRARTPGRTIRQNGTNGRPALTGCFPGENVSKFAIGATTTTTSYPDRCPRL